MPSPSRIKAVLAVSTVIFLTAGASVLVQGNAPPTVVIPSVPTLNPPNTTVTLTATVTDDGLPAGSTVTVRWCKESGPGPVVFADPFSTTTAATFDVAGQYVIQLRATDGDKTRVKNVNVTLNPVSNLPVAVPAIIAATPTNPTDPLFADRFLTFVPNAFPLNATGAQYYAAVDPMNEKTTLSDFLSANGFTANPPLVSLIADSATGCCSAGVFGNAGDLGFGRRMTMSRQGGDVAFSVTNYDTVQSALIEDPASVILTVSMEYSQTPGASTNQRYVKFYMYDASGNRITDVNFDGRGPKPVPLSCAVCHGGAYSPGGGIPADGNMGAQYLPFDMDTFDFACEDGFTREAQEAVFREFNQAILDTNPQSAVRELIVGWYGGAGLPSPTQNPRFVPPGWASRPELYRQVVAKSCRNCHLTRVNSELDFNDAADFVARQSRISGSLVYGPSPSGFRMPHALRTFERFWLSTTPHQPDVLRAAFDANGDFIMGETPPASRIFVDQSAAGANDGSTWADAFGDLDSAIAAAGPGSGITEIWVAAGTYTPSSAGLADPRQATFMLPDGVAIYGGFAGGETLLEQQDPDGNVTILTGDLAGDDMTIGRAENSYHVVTAIGTGAATRLDGFLIIGGNADTAPDQKGGGLLAVGSSVTIVRCTFDDNQALQGGGVAIDGGGPRLVNSSFYGNDGDTIAGGILIENAADVEVSGCLLSSNRVNAMPSDGGGIYISGSTLDLNNTTMSRNYSEGRGGGLFLSNAAVVDVDNSIIYHSCAAGGMMDEAAQIDFDDVGPPSTLTIDYSFITAITGGLGGTGNFGGDPMFIDDLGTDGIAGTVDDDLRLSLGSPCIDAADNGQLPADGLDLDLDGLLLEPSSLDLAGNLRRLDSAVTPDTGVGDAPLVDTGALEYAVSSLGDCAAGNVGVGVGGPFDVLTVNGTAGGTNRQIFVGTGTPFSIAMSPPPGAAVAPFALFLRLGLPTDDDVFTLPFGIGSMCFRPAPLAPFSSPTNVTLFDNTGLGLMPLASSVPAPFVANVPGIGSADFDLTLQGLIEDVSKPIPISVTNAVLIGIRVDPPVNFPPEAIVPPSPLQVFTNSLVTLDGTASNDPEGEMITFQWMQTMGPMVVLSDDTAPAPTFTAPATATTLEFELVVSDGVNTSTPATLTVSVLSDTPIADAGADQQVVRGTAGIMLDGTGSSDPNDPFASLAFQWTQTMGTPVTLTNPTTPTPSFNAPAVRDTLEFRLVVTDPAMNASTPDFVQVRLVTSFVNDVYPIFDAARQDCTNSFSRRCTSCHSASHVGGPSGGLDLDQAPQAVYDEIVPGRVDLGTPSSSLILLKPLAVGQGGATHGGGDIDGFCTTSDVDYVTILNWIIDQVPNDSP